MTEGWFKLHRELMKKPIWLESTPEQKVILITLLSMANHRGKEWEWKGSSYKAEPGQFVTSLESIKDKCGKGISLQNVRTALKRFEKYEFLTNESTKQNRLITIVNWGIYQAREDESNKETNSELTDTSQTPNSHLTTNKNVKNDKNVKNERNNNNVQTRKERVYDDDDSNKKLAFLLLKLIKQNTNIKEPNLNKWANTIRLMIERDKRTGKEVQDMIVWATRHDFWSGVVLSADSLRRNYDQMLIQKNRNNQGTYKPTIPKIETNSEVEF